MSAIPQAQRGAHVRELFVKTGPNMGVGGFEGEHLESRTSYNMGGKKKRRAPPPPVGLSQYKPKILSDNNVTNVAVNLRKPDPPTHGADTNLGPSVNGHNASKSKPFIMGDKDTPMMLHSSGDSRDLEQGVRDLNLTHQASAVVESGGIGTANPLFDSLGPKIDPSVPKFDPSVPKFDPSVPQTNGVVSVSSGDVAHYDKKTDEKDEPQGVFIPDPDYDEAEMTMTFQDEPDEELNSDQQGKKVYKEYYGEDFSQYLSDEENGFDESRLRKKLSSHIGDRKSKTEVKRSHYKKRESLAGKGRKDKGLSGSNSVRNFSYADSKFGTVNGSNNNRLGVQSMPEDAERAELFVNTGASYEHFLRSMNGEDIKDLVSDGEEVARTPQVSQVPSRYSRPSHKDTMWKKLTWKFKKPRNGFDLNTS